jgi:hypothetical protein
MMEVRKGRGDPTFINALVNGKVAPIFVEKVGIQSISTEPM